MSPQPQAQEWNQFWHSRSFEDFKKSSWSKRRIIQTIEPFLKEGRMILDAGSGSGFFSKYFCERNLKVWSLDYSSEALAITQKLTNGKSQLITADLLNDDLVLKLQQRFDLIFTDGLLEHFTEQQQDVILRNCYKILVPDGILVTFVPNKWSPWELIRPMYMPGIEEDPFVLSQLIRVNERNGFQIFQSGGINTFPLRFSPDKIFGRYFGMLLYTIARKVN